MLFTFPPDISFLPWPFPLPIIVNNSFFIACDRIFFKKKKYAIFIAAEGESQMD